MTPMLEVRDLHVAYGKVDAVRGVSLTVPANRIVAIIGPNGAGKSSLLNAIVGDVRSRGTICHEGRRVDGWPVERRVQGGLCLVPERRELFADLPVEDNLDLGGFAHRRDPAGTARSRKWILELFPRLGERLKQTAGTLSGGEQQMLALGRALMSRPRLLLLDEPSLGLAPIVVREIFQAIARIRGNDMSILVVEQNARLALRTADHAYVMEGGCFALDGPAAQLARDPRVLATYLGTTARAEGVLA